MSLLSSSRILPPLGLEKEPGMRIPQIPPIGTEKLGRLTPVVAEDLKTFIRQFSPNQFWQIGQQGFPKGHLPRLCAGTVRGERIYDDLGRAECANGECLTAADAVTAYERMVISMRRAVHSGLQRDKEDRLTLFLNNCDEVTGQTFGEHENYWISPRSWSQISRGETILPMFLVLRQLIAGNGRVTISGSFRVSERAGFIQALTNHDTLSRRGIINSRNEPLGNSQVGNRLHLICGDGNILVISRYFKLLTTQLVLRGIEDGIFSDIEKEIPYNATESAVGDIHAISKQFGGWRLHSVKHIPAVEVLAKIIKRAEINYARELPEHDRKALSALDWVLSRLGKIPRISNPTLPKIAEAVEGLEGYLCWALKFHSLAQFDAMHRREMGRGLEPLELISQAQAMHDVRAAHCTIDDKFRFAAAESIGITSRMRVLSGMKAPNPGTRTVLRGWLVAEALRSGANLKLGWDKVVVPEMGDGELVMPLPNRTYCGKDFENGSDFQNRVRRFMNGHSQTKPHGIIKSYPPDSIKED